jgi:hypothetical protein
MGFEMSEREQFMQDSDELVKEMTSALARAIGEVMQDFPQLRCAVTCGVRCGEKFSSVIGGGMPIEHPVYDQNMVHLAGDIMQSRGGPMYTGSVGYATADDALSAKAEDNDMDHLGVRALWPFPTGTKN